jgi:hypothetical protein
MFTVMACTLSMRNFQSKEQILFSTLCHDLVLMDGSKCCFAARCSSGLSPSLGKQSIHVGGSITVTDHDFIWLLDAGTVDTKFVVFIKSLRFKAAPAVSLSVRIETDEAEEWCEDGWEKALFDMGVVAHAMKEK